MTATPNIRPPPKSSMTEPAWKRKREVSPERPFATPNPVARRSPPKSVTILIDYTLTSKLRRVELSLFLSNGFFTFFKALESKIFKFM